MIFVKWICLTALMIVVWALTWLFAPVLVLFAKKELGNTSNNTEQAVEYRLPSWLSWFQTPDNSLDGDNGWKTEHWQWRFKLPSWLATYVGHIGWLWRNPACGVGRIELTLLDAIAMGSETRGDLYIADNPVVTGYTLITSKVSFQFRLIFKLPLLPVAWSMNYGWNVTGYVKDPYGEFNNNCFTKKVATLAFSPIRFHSM